VESDLSFVKAVLLPRMEPKFASQLAM